MRYFRLRHGGIDYYAAELDSGTARLWTAPPWAGGEQTDRLVPLRPETLLCPVTPTKIVCVGRNYRAHAAELDNEVPTEPLIFLKPPSALVGVGAPIELPSQSERVDHEGELAVVLGRRLRRAGTDEAHDAVFGYTCMNDVTARDIQKRENKFTRAKSFDTFAPCGPWIVDDLDPSDVAVRVRVDGELRQDGRTRDLVFGVPELLSFISSVMTLEAGDVVSTGTPAGVGPLSAGQTVEVEVEGVGTLRNPVVGLVEHPAAG